MYGSQVKEIFHLFPLFSRNILSKDLYKKYRNDSKVWNIGIKTDFFFNSNSLSTVAYLTKTLSEFATVTPSIGTLIPKASSVDHDRLHFHFCKHFVHCGIFGRTV